MTGPKSTKQLQREKIERDVAEFLANGGSIKVIPHNCSAWNEQDVKFMHKLLRNKQIIEEDEC